MILENELEAALLEASQEAVDMIGYYPTGFLTMLGEKGAKQTAEELMTRPKITHGLEVLWEKKRLDLSIEAIVLENRYKELFSEHTLKVARQSLKDLGYNFKEYIVPQLSKAKWDDKELAAAIDAYFGMLRIETAGQNYNKSDVNRELREGVLQERSPGSVESILQNVSAVLQDLGIRWIKGYKPMTHVAGNVSGRIKKIIFEKGYLYEDQFQPTSSQEKLDRRTREIMRLGMSRTPKGTKTPGKTEFTSTSYVRDPAVRACVLSNANGNCENCKEEGPFVTCDGDHFLEVHHVKQLSEGGSDTIENAVALCPNCHRAFHFSRDKETLVNTLYESTERLKRE